METNIDAKDAKVMAKAENYIAKREKRSHSVMHIAAFVLSIVSVVGFFFWYISIPCGVLAIVFGAISARKLASKLGKTGVVLGIVGVSLTAFIYTSLMILILCDFWY